MHQASVVHGCIAAILTAVQPSLSGGPDCEQGTVMYRMHLTRLGSLNQAILTMTHVDVDLIVEVQYDVCTLIWQNKGSPAQTLHSGSPAVVVMMIMLLVLAVRAVAVGPVCLAIQSFQVRCTVTAYH